MRVNRQKTRSQICTSKHLHFTRHPEKMADCLLSHAGTFVTLRLYISEVLETILPQRALPACACALIFGSTAGSSHVPLPSRPLSTILFFLLPHDCRFLLASVSAVCFPRARSLRCLFFFFISFCLCLFSLLSIWSFSFHVSRDLVKNSPRPPAPPPLPPAAYPPTSFFLTPDSLQSPVGFPRRGGETGSVVHQCITSL